MKPEVMVLGATGFVGGHVARALDRRGYPVHATRRAESSTWHVEDVDIAWHDVDLDRERDALEEALGPCRAVFDCAGFTPNDGVAIDEARRRGVRRLRNVLDASRRSRIGRVVYVSSPATLGTAPSAEDGELREDDFYVRGTVDNAYYEAKFSMEADIYRYLDAGPPTVVAIPGAIFGPGDVGPSTGRLLVELARGRIPALVEGTFNAVDVRDVAETLVAALRQGRPGRRYILGGENLSVAEFAARAAHFCDVDPPERVLPGRPVREGVKWVERVARAVGYEGASPLIGVDHVHFARPLCDERARNELGHDPRGIDAALQEAYAWFRDHGYLRS